MEEAEGQLLTVHQATEEAKRQLALAAERKAKVWQALPQEDAEHQVRQRAYQAEREAAQLHEQLAAAKKAREEADHALKDALERREAGPRRETEKKAELVAKVKAASILDKFSDIR